MAFERSALCMMQSTKQLLPECGLQAIRVVSREISLRRYQKLKMTCGIRTLVLSSMGFN